MLHIGLDKSVARRSLVALLDARTARVGPLLDRLREAGRLTESADYDARSVVLCADRRGERAFTSPIATRTLAARFAQTAERCAGIGAAADPGVQTDSSPDDAY